MDERTVYLYARHNGLNDDTAARFVNWFYVQGGDDLASALDQFRQECVS